jgi:predicted ATPase
MDGVALAIELAASRVGAHGLLGTADLLNNCVGLTWHGQRSALPRHQTLQAVLDWSYNLLSPRDRRVLRSLSAFVGYFTLAAAQAVAADTDLGPPDVTESIAGLIDKSLIWVSTVDGTTYYRLADVTRRCLEVKLVECGEGEIVARRHALYYATTRELDCAAKDAASGKLCIGNVRAALEWSFGGSGDRDVGVCLAARAAPVFRAMSLLPECQRWSRAALAEPMYAGQDPARELTLQEAFASSAMFTRGNSDEVEGAISRALSLADCLGERTRELNLLAGLHTFRTRSGDFVGATAVTQRAAAAANEIGTPAARAVAEWMQGFDCHHAADQQGAQAHCELGFEQRALSGPGHFDVFGYNLRLRAQLVLSRVLWLRGFPDRAEELARQMVEGAERQGHSVNVCVAMLTCKVALWRGDLPVAQSATRYQLAPHYACGLGFRGELAIAQGQGARGVELLRKALEMLHQERHYIETAAFYRALAEGLLQCGQVESAVGAIDMALNWAEQRRNLFEIPNMLRVRGEILLAGPDPDPARAEVALRQAAAAASRQSALGLELRAAIGLARLLPIQGRSAEARDLLEGVYRRFEEGFATQDLQAASELIQALGARHPSRPPLARA